MTTISQKYESGLEDDLMLRPEILSKAVSLYNEMPDEFDGIFFQNDWRKKISIADRFIAVDLGLKVQNGKILHCVIDVGQFPSGDKFCEENQEKLSDLPDPFSAVVDRQESSRAGVADGYLSWSSAILGGYDGRCIEIPKYSAVLEIGTQASGKTALELGRPGGAIARWPYDSTRLTLLINPPWDIWESQELKN